MEPGRRFPQNELCRQTSPVANRCIYQIYPRSFKDTTGNGAGDLVGIIEKLDCLTGTLGVDAIWLSPFYSSPAADFGCHVSEYTDVDSLFGESATFDQITALAYQRDLREQPSGHGVALDSWSWAPSHPYAAGQPWEYPAPCSGRIPMRLASHGNTLPLVAAASLCGGAWHEMPLREHL
jgi:hypothetical protein